MNDLDITIHKYRKKGWFLMYSDMDAVAFMYKDSTVLTLYRPEDKILEAKNTLREAQYVFAYRRMEIAYEELKKEETSGVRHIAE